MAQPTKYKTLACILCILLAGILVAGAVALLLVKHNIDNEEKAALKEEVATLSDELLLGTYDVRFDYPDSVSRFVGVLDRDAADNYVLTLLSEYAPKVVILDVLPDGSLSNPDFGTGNVTYKERLNKVTIVFNKEDYRCTLTK